MQLLADNVAQLTTSTGTGPVTLGAVNTGYRAFSAAFAEGARICYGIRSFQQWEVGVGTLVGSTLERHTVLASSNAGALVDFSSGAKTVYCTAPAEAFDRALNVRLFGAAGDGEADDTPAIHAAVAALPSGGIVYFPPGTYRTTLPIVIAARGLTLTGAGFGSAATVVGATKIVADHQLGAAIRISAHETRIENMTIAASSARTAGVTGATAQTPNCGIHVEGPDLSGGAGAVQRLTFANLAIQKQPSHGLLVSGLASVISLRNVHASYNSGHGFVFNRGGITGRVNTNYNGIVDITECRAHDNGGHLLLIGDPADTVMSAYRFRVINIEGYRNGSNAGILKKQAFVVATGQNLQFESCAFGSEDVESDEAFAGVWIGGRVHKFINNRYIRCSQPAIVGVGGVSTRDIEFNGMMFGGTAYLPFDHAVQVEEGAQQVRVIIFQDQRNVYTQYLAPMPLDSQGYWSHDSNALRADIGVEMRDFSSTPELLIADDAVQKLEFGGLAGGILVLSGTTTNDVHGVVAFRVGTDPFAVALAIGADVVVSTGELTAGSSDGTDGRFCISAHTDGVVYLKNRCGGNRTIRATILAGINRTLETSWA